MSTVQYYSKAIHESIGKYSRKSHSFCGSLTAFKGV